MVTESLNPHELLACYLRERLGKKAEWLQAMQAELFDSLIVGVTDQLSAYEESTLGAQISLGEVKIREGKVRSYLLANVRDRAGPLRLRDALRRWDITLTTSNEFELAARVNARRWRFVDRYLSRVIEPLIRGAATSLGEYYARRPGGNTRVGLLRILEDVDKTWLCAELDVREIETPKDIYRQRYSVH